MAKSYWRLLWEDRYWLMKVVALTALSFYAIIFSIAELGKHFMVGGWL